MISVGWSKKITTYTNLSFEDVTLNFMRKYLHQPLNLHIFIKNLIPVKPKLLWKGEFQHKDDILCSDSTGTGILATGSFDGKIHFILFSFFNNQNK